MSKSKIEWTDRTWNPVTGCTKVSQGCKNCYAETFYERFNGKGSFKNVICHMDRLSMPTTWKKPSMVFVNSMSDLFHEDVPFAFICAVFSVMSDIDHHTYQVLTKRPQRMLEFFAWKKDLVGFPWVPSDNVWLGVSVEDQKTADERIPLLLQAPAAVRFLSCEPLLGNLDIRKFLKIFPDDEITEKINWVIAGGESGNDARPVHGDWLRYLRNQCLAADVPFFFKQWGEYVSAPTPTIPTGQKLSHLIIEGNTYKNIIVEGDTMFVKMGKHKAGRLLDGKEYNAYPTLNL